MIINLTGRPPGQDQRGPGDHPDGTGLGQRLFRASAGEHTGKLTVAFGADDTLVAADQDGSVFRWSLAEQTTLPGAPGRGFAASWVDFMVHGVSAQLAVSTVIPAVAVARASRCTLVHFTDGGYRTTSVALGRSEFLVSASGERFATHDRYRLVVRDFADGAVVWEQAFPRGIATAAIDTRGSTVALAGPAHRFAPSNRCVVTSQHDQRPHEFAFENVAVPGTGCHLGLSSGGELVVCASFREILLVRPGTGEIVRRRRIGEKREEVVPALGLRAQRLICTPDGQVLWLRGRRVADVNWSAQKFRYLPQEGLCDDIALDQANARLAMVSGAGQVDVFEWRGRNPAEP